MNGPIETEVEQITGQLREAATLVEAACDPKNKDVAQSRRLLRSLRNTARRFSRKMLASLPRVDGREPGRWQTAASARIKAKYGGWVGQLNEILKRLKE